MIDFMQALRRALRQDPDVILIGELRDAETAQTALQAAESGHLVLSTMHTVDAAETVGRMIEFFPPAKQHQIRSIFAGVLRGIVSQRLLPRVDAGRIPAVEVMVANSRIADLIRESRTEEITEAIGEGAFFQMQTFSDALIELVLAGHVDREVAANAATNRHDFLVSLVTAPATLPSAQVPNLPGSLVLPPSLGSPPARPEQLSYAELSALWRSAIAAYGVETDISRAVYSYNHAQWYVDEVLATARLFESGGVQAAVTVDRLQQGISTSSAAVVAAGHDLAVARAQAATLAR